MDVIINGLVLGCIYAFVAIGFTFTWTTTSTLNFAQGEMLMVGALVGTTLHVTLGLSLWLTVFISVAGGAVLSIVVYWGAIAPFSKGKDTIAWILATIAVSIGVRAISTLIWGKTVMSFPPFLGDDLLEFGPFVLETQQIVIIVALIAVVSLLHVFLHGTLWGKALTAVAQNRVAASLSAISPNLIASIGFGISGALAALAGLLIAPVTFASTNMGGPLLVKAFTVSVLAGLSSLWGAVWAGILFGVTEALVARYLGSELRNLFGLALLIAVLMIRPTGLFGPQPVVKV